MPNHITNTIEILAPKSKVNSVLKFIKSKDSLFDFNTLIPLPAILSNTVSGSSEFNTNLDTIQDQYNKVHNKEEFIKSVHAFLQTGYSSWYHFTTQNWGTKWNSYEISIENNTIQFQTAGSHPTPIIEELSEKFPNISFLIQFIDEVFHSENYRSYEIQNSIVEDFGADPMVLAKNLLGYVPTEEEELIEV